MCLPVELGDLRIRSVASFNQALLGKWLGRFCHEVTHLWRRVISTKYGEGQRGVVYKSVQEDSWMWPLEKHSGRMGEFF